MKKFLRICLIACLIDQAVLAQAPVITTNPKDTSVCVGTDVTLSVMASNNPTGYIWQYNPNPVYNTWTAIQTTDPAYSGSNTNELTIHSSSVIPWKVGGGLRIRCIAANADGSSIPSPTAIVKIAQPHPDFAIYGEINACKESTSHFGAFLNLNIDSITWSYSGTGLTIHTGHTNNNSGQDSGITVDINDYTTEGIMTAIDSNTCGVYGPATFALTISPEQRNIAGIAGQQVCTSSFGPDMAGSKCAPIFHYAPSGANPVNVYLNGCVTLDPTVQSYGGVPYVQRHYTVNLPAGDPATSTATLTLYYTQEDFDAYNLARGSNPALPANPSDAAGIANLRITQFHGDGTTPGTYTGTTGEIDPDDSKILWNATDNRWEVTFDIIGFSGFYVSTRSLVPLPLTLTDFKGETNETGNLLKWTTATEQNTAHFEIQRHTPGSDFTALAKIPAAGNSHQPRNYQYTDNDVSNDTLSYRLKMVDLDGQSTYSKTVVLQHQTTDAYTVRMSPNPFHSSGTLDIIAPTAGVAILTITDLSGKQLYQQQMNVTKGNNPIGTRDIDYLRPGTYLLTLQTTNHRQTLKLVKY